MSKRLPARTLVHYTLVHYEKTPIGWTARQGGPLARVDRTTFFAVLLKTNCPIWTNKKNIFDVTS